MTTATEAPAEPTVAAADPPIAAATSDRTGGLLVGIGLNEASLRRIRDSGSFEVMNDANQVVGADIVAISTRVERGQTARMPADVDPEHTPIVVVCHPGGEETAVRLMQQGCAGVIAEGNEKALGSFVDPTRHTDLLVEGFLDREGTGRGGRAGGQRDPITDLPEAAAFEARIAEMFEGEPRPNVIMMEITNLDKARQRTDARAVDLLRRRLASFYRDAASRYSCEVFSLTESKFAVVDGAQLLLNPERFGRELIQITEAFRPAGVKLHLAVGAVIGTVESDVAAIREQAEQAVMAAAQQGGSAFVTSEDVTVLLASATEYNVAKMLVSFVDQQVPNPPGHSVRVADLAVNLAREIGYTEQELANIRLAALLHDIGRVPSVDGDQAGDESAPERGARYVLASAGPEIADAVRYHAERWDGAGPAALVEDDIPLSARIIAIAKAVDLGLHPADGDGAAVSPGELIQSLEKESGTRFDPTVIETLARLLGA